MNPSRHLLVLALLETFAGCGGSATSSAGVDASVEPSPDAGTTADASVPYDGGPALDATGDTTAGGDRDQDGIDDALEATYADAYLPYLSIHPSDGCKTHGLLYRVAPHPTEPKRVMMWIDVLYNDDCGAAGHAGDDEVFGVVLDPAQPAPEGILAVRAISHQGTACEHTTTCGACSGMSACGTTTSAGKAYPVVYPSKDKHGNYADLATCSASFVCDFGGCALNPTPDAAPKVNAGEPAHPLVHDLTTQGFVTTANGWTHPELMNFDPWKAGTFGGAGDISKDLADTSFVIDTTKCP